MSPLSGHQSHRQGADPRAGGSEDRIGQRWNDRRQCRLTQSGRRLVGYDPGDFYLGCHGDSREREVMKVTLLPCPIDKLDCLASQCLCQTVDYRSAHLILRAHGIYDLAANVSRDPYPVDGDIPACNAGLDDFRKIPPMRKIESESLGPAALSWLLRPPRSLHDFLHHIPGASGVKRW